MGKKFFKQIFAPYALPIIGGLIGGPAGAAVGGAVGGAINKSTEPGKQSFGDLAGSAAMGGAMGYGGAKLTGSFGTSTPLAKGTTQAYLSPAQLAQQNSLNSGIFGKLGNAFSSGFGVGNIGNNLSSLFGGISNPFSSGTAYAATPGTSSGGVGNALSSFGSMIPGGGGGNPMTAMTSTTSPGLNQASGGSVIGKNSGSLFGGMNKTLLGGLATMLGSQFIKSPKVPENPQSIKDYQNFASQGSAIGNLGQQKLTEQLNQNMMQVSQQEIDAALRQLQESQDAEMRQLTGTYKSLRPGTDITTDSSYARDVGQLNDRYARSKADITAQLNRQVYNDFQTQRAQQIAQASGFDVNRAAQLLQAGKLDLDQLMSQLSIDYSDKQFLRDYLLQFGGNVAASQLGVQSNPFASMFNQ